MKHADVASVLGRFGLSLSHRPDDIRKHCVFRTIWSDLESGLLLQLSERAEKNCYLLDVPNVAAFLIDVPARRISVCGSPPKTIESTLEHLLLDQVVPRIIAHDGKLVCHAALLATAVCAIAVLGPSGRGKSTLVASLQLAGYKLHGDDALMVDERVAAFHGCSVYRSLRVLPDTLARLFTDGAEVRTVAYYSDKLRVTLPPSQETLPPVPLRALVFLGLPAADHRIILRPMRPAEACMALIENSFALDPTDKARALDKLVKAGDLAAAVPAFELSYPRDYDRLDDVRRALLDAGILPPLDAGATSPDHSA